MFEVLTCAVFVNFAEYEAGHTCWLSSIMLGWQGLGGRNIHLFRSFHIVQLNQAVCLVASFLDRLKRRLEHLLDSLLRACILLLVLNIDSHVAFWQFERDLTFLLKQILRASSLDRIP